MMGKMLGNRWVGWGLQLLLGGVFLYTGARKLAAPQAFADSVAAFRLLPEGLVSLLALGLPVFELAIGGWLVIGWSGRAAALGALLLTGVFALALAAALVRGLPVDCGCFGSGAPSAHGGWISLGRDLLLGGAAFALWRQSRGAGWDGETIGKELRVGWGERADGFV